MLLYHAIRKHNSLLTLVISICFTLDRTIIMGTESADQHGIKVVQNTYDVVITAEDSNIYLAMSNEIDRSYRDVGTINRDENGTQYSTQYKGMSLSLTLYNTTNRLHVQGDAYQLWTDEVFSVIRSSLVSTAGNDSILVLDDTVVPDQPLSPPQNTTHAETTPKRRNKYCTHTCKIKNQNNMIRCMLCMHWYHLKCVGEKNDYNGVWTCNVCRDIPSQLSELQAQFDSIKSIIPSPKWKEEKSKMETELEAVRLENRRLVKENQDLKSSNHNLNALIDSLLPQSDSASDEQVPSHELHVSQEAPTLDQAFREEQLLDGTDVETAFEAWQIPRSHRRKRTRKSAKKRKQVTIMSSSMAKGVAELVDQADNLSAFAYCYPGRGAHEIANRMKKVLPHDKADILVVQAGSCNVEKDSLVTCKSEIKECVDVAANYSEKSVIFCTVPERQDKPSLNIKIEQLNSYIVDEVLKHDNMRVLIHDAGPSHFKRDGLHFNDKGRACFAHEIILMSRNQSDQE